MNLSLKETGGSILAVSQFTLAASIKKGRRPSFDQAESPDRAANLFNYFIDRLEASGLKVETGVFQAMMDVYLVMTAGDFHSGFKDKNSSKPVRRDH